MPKLRLTGDPAADALLGADPFALLVGMLLDHQKSMRMFIYRSQTFPASRSVTATRICTRAMS
ncbi:hypothetical protein AWC06_05705 [Mycobacterium fragae]|uniref:Uncharacterized protein n=1 Tax=Mycobacterium fragae TaxID=1260918 RepID=A0A1X1V689_9MYCO|nr:hypothetical protein AWC06_05705 [Mycobacterium fragae]